MKENRIIDILVPVYGKETDFVFDNLSKIKLGLSSECGLIIVYKNSSKFNYDKLKELNCENVVVIEGKFDFQKTDKLLLALKNSNAKYILPMDSHHFVLPDKLANLADALKESNHIMVTMDPIDVDVDSGEEFIITEKWLHAGKYIINTNKLKGLIKEIKYRTTFSDDLTFPLFISKEIDDNIDVPHTTTPIYLKRKGKSLSNTMFITTFDVNFQVVTSLKNILLATSEYFNSTKLFNSQFITTFWYYVIRTESFDSRSNFRDSRNIITKDLVLRYWNDIFNSEIDISELELIFQSNNIYSNKFDVELSFLRRIFPTTKID